MINQQYAEKYIGFLPPNWLLQISRPPKKVKESCLRILRVQDSVAINSMQSFVHLPIIEQTRLLTQCITPKNHKGSGAQGEVYRIGNTDVVAKVKRGCKRIIDTKISQDISQEEKVNHVIAKTSDAILMKYIEGSTTDKIQKEQLNNFVNTMPLKTTKGYITQLCEAGKVNMHHDFGGANAVINETTKSITAIDFYNAPGKKTNIFEDVFFQLGLHLNNPKDKEKLLAKTCMSLLDLIKTNIVTPQSITKLDMDTRRVQDLFKIENVQFATHIQNKLEKIAGLKKLQKISADVNNSLNNEIKELESFIQYRLLTQ